MAILTEFLAYFTTVITINDKLGKIYNTKF